MCGPLNSAATTARRVFAPAARVTVERGATRETDLNRLIFGHQYGPLFGFVVVDQIAGVKRFASKGTSARIFCIHPHLKYSTRGTLRNSLNPAS